MASQFPPAPGLTDDGQPWPDQSGQMPLPPPADSGYWWPKILGGVWNSLKSGATLPGDVATGQAHTTDPNFAGRVADMTGLVTGGAAITPAEEDALRMGITAYHGSPHSFDQFDISKIGTGEGAQAYGHGLYFADSEGVAKSYRESLAGKPTPPTMQWNGAPAFPQTMNSDFDPTVRNGVYELHGRLSNYTDPSNPEIIDRTKTALLNTINNYENGHIAMDDSHYQAAKDANTVINDPRFSMAPAATPGHVYQVDINADPEHFLDWDKPLSEQHPTVRQKLADTLAYHKVPLKNNAGGETTGGQMMGYLQSRFGNDVDPASELSDSNIPGIKYLDQSSRRPAVSTGYKNVDIGLGQAGGDWNRFKSENAGKSPQLDAAIADIDSKGGPKFGPQSHNYVVFNDALVNVLKKYGIAGGAGATGVGALMNHPDSAQAGQFPPPPPY